MLIKYERNGDEIAYYEEDVVGPTLHISRCSPMNLSRVMKKPA